MPARKAYACIQNDVGGTSMQKGKSSPAMVAFGITHRSLVNYVTMVLHKSLQRPFLFSPVGPSLIYGSWSEPYQKDPSLVFDSTSNSKLFLFIYLFIFFIYKYIMFVLTSAPVVFVIDKIIVHIAFL